MKYVVSSDLVAINLERSIIQNKKTGERFEVTNEVLRLLGCFKEPHTIREVMKIIDASPDETKDIQNFIRHLREDHIIVPYPEKTDSPPSSILTVSNEVLVHTPERTFFDCPSAELASIRANDIVFLGVPFDLGTTGFPGARFAPDRIREVSPESFAYQADIFDGSPSNFFPSTEDSDVGRSRRFLDVGNVILHVGENFDDFYLRVENTIDKILKRNGFPVVVGGDHSCTYPTVKSFKNEYNRLGVIHIDAHTDLADRIPGIPNNHGNVFTRILDEALVEHIHQFGLRGLPSEGHKRAECSIYTMDQLKRTSEIEEVVKKIDPAIKYYLSLDIDVLDPSQAPGTGTPVPGGMTMDALCGLLSLITSRVKVVGFDVMEVNPMLDINNQTSAIASSVILHLLLSIFGHPK